MKKIRSGPDFTHFASLPFIKPQHRDFLSATQNSISEAFAKVNKQNCLEPNNVNLFHLTISMLTLPHTATREKVCKVLSANEKEIYKILEKTVFTTSHLGYFTRKDYKNPNAPSFVNVIYLDLLEDDQYAKVGTITDWLIRTLMQEEIIVAAELKSMNIEYDHKINKYVNKKPHITLFRCKGVF